MVKWNPLDPELVVSFDERQKMAIFASCVPGKTAATVWRKVEKFLADYVGEHQTPFECLHQLVVNLTLGQVLKEAKLSPYVAVTSRLTTLSTLPTEFHWTALGGKSFFGPKTVRFIALYTQPDVEVAALDVHILRWLRKQGHDAPVSTPPTYSSVYNDLERVFLQEARRLKLKPWELDRKIWMEGRRLSSE